MIYPSSLTALEADFNRAAASPVTDLARRLVEGAKRFDLKKAENLDVNFRYRRDGQKFARDMASPPEFTTDEAANASWADPHESPLQPGESWNKGRRRTASGVPYTVEHDRRAINPYMNTGITGRGCLGQEGPNHAVDNGMLIVQPDRNGTDALYAIGIRRKYDNDAPAFAGGFAKFTRDEGGAYIFDDAAVIQTKLEEFFEEMVSGSVPLLPEYAAKLPVLLALEVQERVLNLKNPQAGPAALSKQAIEKIAVEMETHVKFQQVCDLDPGFIERLRAVIATGKECFAGPVLNDDRNTNNAWLETRLSWFMMDKDVCAYIRGDHPVFNYQFSAGDDASGVVCHRFTPALIEKAFASHGAMFAFMAASYLLDSQEKKRPVPPSIIRQLQDIDAYFQGAVPQPV